MNNHGEHVLSAHATLPALGWLVFVELPRSEALEPLYEFAVRTAAVLLAGLVLATLVALFLVRRMVGPIRLLQAGAARIGAGDLDSRIDVRTGDELESLGGPVQHHGRAVAAILRRARAQGGGAHAGTARIARIPDRDQ